MIVKDYSALPTTDRFQRAGDEAEKQMAFYLKRTFGDDSAVHVYHNLRLEDGPDVAQIDYLVLHRHGAILLISAKVGDAFCSSLVEVEPKFCTGTMPLHS